MRSQLLALQASLPITEQEKPKPLRAAHNRESLRIAPQPKVLKHKCYNQRENVILVSSGD